VEGDNFDAQSIPGVEKVNDFGRLQELRMAKDTNPQSLLSELMKRGRVVHFELTRPSLHDIFVRIARPGADSTIPPVQTGVAHA
jgi:ABC-2 type transport system ATP-binding protein